MSNDNLNILRGHRVLLGGLTTSFCFFTVCVFWFLFIGYWGRALSCFVAIVFNLYLISEVDKFGNRYKEKNEKQS